MGGDLRTSRTLDRHHLLHYSVPVPTAIASISARTIDAPLGCPPPQSPIGKASLAYIPHIYIVLHQYLPRSRTASVIRMS